MISYKIWEYFIFIMRFASLIEVFSMFGSKNVSTLVESRSTEIIFLIVWILDIVVNFLA